MEIVIWDEVGANEASKRGPKGVLPMSRIWICTTTAGRKRGRHERWIFSIFGLVFYIYLILVNSFFFGAK